MIRRQSRCLTERLTYANVVATLALFASLGGASYAAITLPADSVGSKQLRAGAVGLGALRFPLGTIGITDDKVEDLTKGSCNSPPRPGEPRRADCPVPKESGISTPGHEVHLSLHSPGALMVSAIVGLRNEGPTNTTADLMLHVIVDGRPASHSELTLTGSQSAQAPAQLLTNVPAGSHTVGIEVEAKYSSYEPGDVLVSPVSLNVTALPSVQGGGK